MANNLSIDELAELMVNSILEETVLNKQNLIPKVKALIRTMVDLKNTPKNYEKKVSENKNADRLRTIEKRGAEVEYWRNEVRRLDAENIEQHYQQLKQFLLNKGFET